MQQRFIINITTYFKTVRYYKSIMIDKLFKYESVFYYTFLFCVYIIYNIIFFINFNKYKIFKNIYTNIIFVFYFTLIAKI